MKCIITTMLAQLLFIKMEKDSFVMRGGEFILPSPFQTRDTLSGITGAVTTIFPQLTDSNSMTVNFLMTHLHRRMSNTDVMKTKPFFLLICKMRMKTNRISING